MSELSKNQLTQENNNSFPNNNTGYITPTLLRTFNQNMIDSLVDEQQYNVDSASFNQRINVLDPSGSAQAINSLQIATASLNAYTASQNSFNSSATASIVALQNFSSSLDTTYATDAQLSASVSQLSSSVTVTTNGLSSSIGALQQFSSSLDTTFATDAQLSASASTLQNNINSLSQSVAVTDLAQSQSIAALQQFSSSLDSTFATDAQLSASASTLQNNINTKLDSASFNTYTQSAASGVSASINAATSSLSQSLSASIGSLSASVAVTTRTLLTTESFNVYTSSTSQQISQLYNAVSQSATTGSNTFRGNQIVSGNVNIAGNITAVSASFIYITTVFETASVIFSSGSNQLGDELSDVQTLSGSVRVQGALTVNGVPVLTSSFDASGYLLTSSFNTYTQSAASGVSASINSATQSLSSSIAVTTNNNTLLSNRKLDSSSFNSYTQSNDTKVNALIAQTGSYAISSSVASAINALSASVNLTYATETELSASASTLQNGINSKVENSTFNSYTQSTSTQIAGLGLQINARLTTASFNSYTSSNDSKVNSLIAATSSYITSAQTSSMRVLSSSFATTASFALNVTPTDVTPFLSKSAFDAYTGSAALGVSASINSATQSLSSSIAVTTNNLDLEVNGKLDSSSFNTYTQSNDSKVNSLISATGSYITSAQTSSMRVLSSSFAVTASFAENVTPTDVSMFVSQSTFNAYTQSNDGKVNSLISATSSYAISSSVAAIDTRQDGQINSLIAQTSSYVTESETGSFARVNVSNVFTQNQTISGNLDVTGKITALSASITYLDVIYQTSSVIFSSGSNILGDELSDTQTLSGSVLVQGLLRVNGVAPILVGATASYASASISSSFATTSTTASFALNGGVTQLLAGPNITISPLSGKGQVTISSTGTGSGNFNTATGSYGSFYDTTTQTNPVANAANSMSFNETAITNGIALSGSISPFNTYIKTANAGVYNIQFSAQVDKTDGGSDDIDIWIRKNGIDLLDTATKLTLPTNNSKVVAAWNWFVQSATNDYYQLIWASADTSMRLFAEPSSSAHPGIPSVIATANRVDQFLSNTGSFSGTFNGYNLTEFTTTSSFNSYTQSNNSRVDSLIAKTGSYATTASNTFIGNQIISGNLLVTGSNINLEVDAPALSVGVTNVKTVLDATASGVVSSTDITRLGAGATGDLSGIRLQTLSGSDTTGDTLLSRINTGVNRHTSTGMTGSVVNSTLLSTWATGSGGTRVSYTSTVNANAQSASATLTLSAGAGATLAGGTASLAAGLVRLGSNAAHRIAPTGSFTSIIIDGVLNQPAFSLRSGSFEVTTPQGSGSFYTNLPITSSAGRINGDLIVTNNITASVISASTYIGIPVGSFATTGSNTFKDTQTIDLSATSIITASSIIGNATEVITDMYVNGGNFDTFNVQVVANGGVKLRDYNNVLDVTPFLSVDTNGGNVRIPRNTNITGSLNVSASLGGDDGNLIRGGLTIVGDNNGNGLGIKSGSFALTTPQGAGFFYSNVPITSSALRINGTALVADLIVSGVFGGNSSVNVIGAITASVISASQYIGITQVNTSSLATTGSNTFRDTQYIISGAISGTLVDNAGSIYTQSNAVRHIVNLGSASYASIVSPDANTLYVITGDEQYVLIQQTASFATTGSNRFNGNQTITGSLTLSSSAAVELNVIGNTLLSGSVQGNVSAITIASTTASIDCNLGNFFTLTLANGTNHISASNIRPGQTINVRVTTQTGNAVTCSSVIRQPSGSLYTPTNASGTDILTLVAYDNTTLFMAAVRNMI